MSAERLRRPDWIFAAVTALAVAGVAILLSLRIAPQESANGVLIRWTPHLLIGFRLNILMGLAVMALGSTAGGVVGAVSFAGGPAGRIARWLGQGLRTLPWLAVIFFVMYLTPFELQVGDTLIPVPGWLKTILALTLPATGYLAEVVRGGFASVATPQWEAASAIGLTPSQSLLRIILPIAVRRMAAPWLNVFCTVMLATSLGSVVGVEELLTAVHDVIASEPGRDIAFWAYAYAMLLFFIAIQPVTLLSRRLERQWRDS